MLACCPICGNLSRWVPLIWEYTIESHIITVYLYIVHSNLFIYGCLNNLKGKDKTWSYLCLVTGGKQKTNKKTALQLIMQYGPSFQPLGVQSELPSILTSYTHPTMAALHHVCTHTTYTHKHQPMLKHKRAHVRRHTCMVTNDTHPVNRINYKCMMGNFIVPARVSLMLLANNIFFLFSYLFSFYFQTYVLIT